MGGSFATRGGLARSLNYLPEAYFLYFEETEYCLKVRSKGYRVVYIPGGIAYHAQESDDRRIRNWRFVWRYHRSRYLFALRNLKTVEERQKFVAAELDWRRKY